MRLIEDEQFIESFIAYRSNPALGKGVGIRGEQQSMNDMHLLGTKNSIERLGELSVIVAD